MCRHIEYDDEKDKFIIIDDDGEVEDEFEDGDDAIDAFKEGEKE